MRKTYRLGHSVAQGGWLYAHRVGSGIIRDREGLRQKLMGVETRFGLIDVTIKIYGNIFFFFFMAKPTIVHQKLIEEIQQAISGFGDWNKECLHTGVYDLQEQYLRKDLEGWGFDFDGG